jgi:hypothetical protein
MVNLAAQELGYPQAEGWERYMLLVLSQLGIFAVPTFLFTSGSFISYVARCSPQKAALEERSDCFEAYPVALSVLVHPVFHSDLRPKE